MLRVRLGAIVALLLVFPLLAHGQCSEPHYRWSEKTDESLASVPAVQASVTTILTWTPLGLTGDPASKCAARAGRELRVYDVRAWVRRVKTGEADGDWHIELTARQNSPVGSCIVVEIPPAALSGKYSLARQDLQSLVTWDSHGDVSPPVRLRIIGAAFFDGQHRGGPTHLGKTDGAHGRCNSSVRALWELHPVYWVRLP